MPAHRSRDTGRRHTRSARVRRSDDTGIGSNDRGCFDNHQQPSSERPTPTNFKMPFTGYRHTSP